MNYWGFKTKKQNKFIMLCTIAVAVIGIGVVLFLMSKAVENNKGYRTIGVVETKGTVTVVKDGIDYKAYPGMHLQEGQILVTAGESSVRLVLDGDKYIKVEGGSRVVFETLGFLGSGKTKIVLERGSMTGELVNPLETGQEFVVNTPNAVLAVRGTFFRVELENYGRTEVRTNVLTYGGAVASRRIFPTGETEEREVLVESGYKTAIHMNPEDTFYVLEKTEGAKDTTGDNNNDIEPIYREDIADDDWVDIYYSAENGHELFVTVEEAKKEIEERNISLEDTISIYEKAADVFLQKEETTGGGVETVVDTLSALPDDSKMLAMAEVKEEAGSEGLNGNDIYVAKQELQSGLLTDGSGKDNIIEEPIVDADVEITEEVPGIEENDQGDIKETTNSDLVINGNIGNKEDTGTNEEKGNEESTGGVQESVTGGSMGNTGGGSTGGNTGAGSGSSGSSGGNTGAGSGGNTGSGSGAGGTHTHTEVYVGSMNIHSMCSECGETLSTTHEYTDEVIHIATCLFDGEMLYSCECGYSYAMAIEATGHTPTAGGEMFIHSKCLTCGDTLEDETSHVMVEISREEPTCMILGNIYKKCECGYDEDHIIPLAGHQYDSSTDTCSTCELPMIEIDSNKFPDEAFRTFVMQYDTDNDYYLHSTELAQVTSMSLYGGTYTSLKGIEYFIQLQELDCTSNANLTELDLSANVNLQNLLVYSCIGLTNLNVSNTKISTLDIDTLANLQTLSVSNCSNIQTLGGTSCNNLREVDASNCLILSSVVFRYAQQLEKVNVSGNAGLYDLILNSCSNLTDGGVNVTGCTGGAFSIMLSTDMESRGTAIFTGYDSGMLLQYGDY